MKSITNTAIQSFEIYLNTNKGAEVYWLKPQETIVVPASYLSEQVHTLAQRRILRIQSAV